MNWHVAGCSETGPFRTCNEDRYLVDESLSLLLVTDGIGGLGQGELAAEMVCRTIRQQMSKGLSLAQATVQAHRRIRAEATREPGKRMGATLVALHLPTEQPGRLVWAGDSRAYRLRGGKLEALTRDHSFVQGLLEAGAISTEEARTHPQRNVLTRALGQKLDKLSCRSIHPRVGDRYLLCSDGISNVLDDEGMVMVMENYPEAEDCVQALVDTALGAGSRDNLTAVVLDLVECDS